MKKRWSNYTQISRAFLILASTFFLLLVLCGAFQNNLRTQYVNDQYNPFVAQATSPSISCGLTNGASFAAGELESVNWSIAGYIGMRYVLIHNNISEDFGLITTNTSFIVRQGIGGQTSWQYCGVQIYDGNTLIGEEYVAFEVKEGFWTLNTVIMLAAGSVVSVAIATDVVMWRKVKHAKSGRDVSFPLTRPTPVLHPIPGVLATQTPEEEAENTSISAMRVIRIWIWNGVVQDYYHKWMIREDLSIPKRIETIEGEIAQVLKKMEINALERAQFLNLVAMLDSDRLLVVPLMSPLLLVMLFSGRITASYLKQIQETILEVKKNFETVTREDLPKVFTIMDARLKIQQSRIYIEPAEETTHVLHEGPFPEILKDPEILGDARGLSPLECQEITTLMKNLSTRKATDSLIDEVEDLSREFSKN